MGRVARWLRGFVAAGCVSIGLAAPGHGAHAAQTSFDKARAGNTVKFDVAWSTDDGKADHISFRLPAAAVDADRDELTYLPRDEMYTYAAEAVRAYGRTLPDVRVTATVRDNGLRIDVSGTGDVHAALAGAERARDDATDRWLADHGFSHFGRNTLGFDHAALAARYAPALRPVAEALRDGATSDRALAERALAFVQSIPYEKRTLKGTDPGYRRPIALLARNRGDCDSKAVLYLAILRAALPDVPLAVVYVPNHALTGVGIPPAPSDAVFKRDGARFVYAEPVGPSMLPFGAKVPRGHRVGKGEARTVPIAAPAPG